MTRHLDLEEQEQIDQLKHFWTRYGKWITGVFAVALGSVAAWNAYQNWRHQRAEQAAGLYEELERAAQAGDMPKVERSLADIQARSSGTVYADQALLLAAKLHQDKGNPAAARAALNTVIEKSADEGYRATARLRLAGIALDAKAYDEATRILSAQYPEPFLALVADRRGDALLMQGKRDQARAEYLNAYQLFEDRVEYRRVVEVKLNALGVDPRTPTSAAKGQL